MSGQVARRWDWSGCAAPPVLFKPLEQIPSHMLRVLADHPPRCGRTGWIGRSCWGCWYDRGMGGYVFSVEYQWDHGVFGGLRTARKVELSRCH